MIFADAHKYDGNELVPLSLSQLKQIAGRAGRYGLHGSSSAPGLVTSLKKEDLPAITRAVLSKSIPLTPHAVLPLTLAMHEELEQLLPAETPFATVADLQRCACRLPPHFMPGVSRAEASVDAAKALDDECQGMTLVERMRAADAPVAWRDDGVRPIALKFMCAYRTKHIVRWAPSLEETGLLDTLAVLRAAREGKPPPPAPIVQQNDEDGKETNDKSAKHAAGLAAKREAERKAVLSDLPTALAKLETLYRIAVVYMWHGMRAALAYPDREEAVKVKEECQELIEWCLGAARGGRFNARHLGRGRGKAVGANGRDTVGGEGEGELVDTKMRMKPLAGAMSPRPSPKVSRERTEELIQIPHHHLRHANGTATPAT